MAKIHKFGSNTVVTDLNVNTPEGNFAGAVHFDGRYSSLCDVALEQAETEITEELKPYAMEVIEAAARYEMALLDARLKLEAKVRDAAEALAKKREEAERNKNLLPMPSLHEMPTAASNDEMP